MGPAPGGVALRVLRFGSTGVDGTWGRRAARCAGGIGGCGRVRGLGRRRPAPLAGVALARPRSHRGEWSPAEEREALPVAAFVNGLLPSGQGARTSRWEGPRAASRPATCRRTPRAGRPSSRERLPHCPRRFPRMSWRGAGVRLGGRGFPIRQRAAPDRRSCPKPPRRGRIRHRRGAGSRWRQRARPSRTAVRSRSGSVPGHRHQHHVQVAEVAASTTAEAVPGGTGWTISTFPDVGIAPGDSAGWWPHGRRPSRA